MYEQPVITTCPLMFILQAVPVSPPSPTGTPTAGGGAAAMFPWWPIVASVGGAALMTIMACIAFNITVEYRRRLSLPLALVPQAWLPETEAQGSSGMVVMELLSEDDVSIPSISLTD